MEKFNQIIDERIQKCRDSIESNKTVLDELDTEITNLYIDVRLAGNTEEMCRLENELSRKKCQYREKKVEFEEKEKKIKEDIVKLESLKE